MGVSKFLSISQWQRVDLRRHRIHVNACMYTHTHALTHSHAQTYIRSHIRTEYRRRRMLHSSKLARLQPVASLTWHRSAIQLGAAVYFANPEKPSVPSSLPSASSTISQNCQTSDVCSSFRAEGSRASGRKTFEHSTAQEMQPLAVSVRYIARLLQSDEYACAQVVALGVVHTSEACRRVGHQILHCTKT